MEEHLSVYRVEISGWDINEQFFVERAALQWGEGNERTVLIRRRVRQGALVFIRLLLDTAPSCAIPVAYRARQIREREDDASYELKLTQVWPTEPGASPEGAALFDAVRDRTLGIN